MFKEITKSFLANVADIQKNKKINKCSVSISSIWFVWYNEFAKGPPERLDLVEIT